MFYLIFLLFILGIIYVSQNKNVLQNYKLKIIDQEKTIQQIDCSGNWSSWNECNTYTGTRTRTFITTFNKLNNGILCPTNQIEDCNVDCSGNWSAWNNWSDCSTNTGIRNRIRTYRIINQHKNNGLVCPSEELETNNCNVDCSGNWNDWSICNTNTGTKTRRYRIINQHKNNGLICPSEETINCNVDCSGNWSIWSECNIDKCDISNNNNGIGKQTRTYIISELPKNGGKICPSNETIECITENYEFCTQCKGQWSNLISDCQNIGQCYRTTGIGIKNNNYISTNPLPNCIMPKTNTIICTVPNYPACTCSYNILDDINCNNNNNTECKYVINEYGEYPENPESICTSKIITEELPGGICPEPNTRKIVNDSRCNCFVERTFGNWNYTDERCNSTTYSANRSRRVTVKKIGGLKGCLFPKKQNENIIDSTKGISLNNKFQFERSNDDINKTFDIIETENINWPNNDRCICEGTTWSDGTVCPSSTDYSIPESHFNKMRRTTTKTIPGKVCNDDYILCPRDCSGNWNDWTVCNIQNKKTRTFRTTFNKLNNGVLCPTDQIEDCSLNCIGNWNNWTVCNNQGKRTRTFNKLNNSVICPTDEIENCRFDCSGNWTDWGQCYVNQCTGTTGRGKKTRQYAIRYFPQNGGNSCPTTDPNPLNCIIENHPACTCSYQILSNDCNVNNTICEEKYYPNINDSPQFPFQSICSRSYTKTANLPGGICPPPPTNIYNIIPSDRTNCECTFKITFSNWTDYTDKKCNNRTFSATRTRVKKVTKTGGFRGCVFSEEQNKDFPAEFKRHDGYFQFRPSDDFFDIVQVENLISNNDFRCLNNIRSL